MSGSINKVILVGKLGRDPEIRTISAGQEIATISLATNDYWKDKNTGERKEKTEWHRIVIYNQVLTEIAKKHLKKGAKVFVCGSLQTREWTELTSNTKHYAAEIVLQPYKGELCLLDNKQETNSSAQPTEEYNSDHLMEAPF